MAIAFRLWLKPYAVVAVSAIIDQGSEMLKHVVAALLVLLSSACVSTKNMKADAAALKAGDYRTYTISNREKPSFAAMTAGKAAIGGMIGAAAMIAAGNTIVRENEVPDPAVYIGQTLSETLARNLELQPAETQGKVAKTGKPGELAKLYANSGLLIDVQTVNWSFVYFPMDWNNYRVIYSAKLRLIDTRNGKVMGEGFCSRVPEDKANAPTRDQLLADKAAVLKAELQKAAEHCVTQFQTNVLGLN